MKTYRSGSRLFGTERVVQAVQNVPFDLVPGRTLGVVGESGSGKSSMGRLLVKPMESDSGQIIFEGQDIARLPENRFRVIRPKIQMIFQDPFASLNPRSTVGHILTVGPCAHGVPYREAKASAHELLKKVGLDAGAFDRHPHEFSGGQRQRVGIARALMSKPRLLVADESVSALDVSIQAQILTLLDQIQRDTGVAMVFITHDLRVASQICDEIVVMQKGRIVESGPPSQIHIMFREILPNAMGPIIVAATLTIARAILTEAYISFLGYGIQPPLPSWGNMLNGAQQYLESAPWLAIVPGVAITMAVTSFNFIGDGLRDALDVRSDPR